MLKETGFALTITSGVIVAKESDSILLAAELMKKNNIGAVVVLRKDKIAGIISERDIVHKMVCGGLSAKETKIKDVMTKKVITADIKDGLLKIHEIMRSASFRHLPITRDGKLIGIVSNRNLLSSFSAKK